jgi:hypothetical protein
MLLKSGYPIQLKEEYQKLRTKVLQNYRNMKKPFIMNVWLSLLKFLLYKRISMETNYRSL